MGVSTLLLTALLFGFFPTFVMNALARVYPKGRPRRDELVAELRSVPRRERLVWLAEQLATVLFDGIPARVGTIIEKHRQAKAARNDSPQISMRVGKVGGIRTRTSTVRNSKLSLEDAIGSDNAIEVIRLADGWQFTVAADASRDVPGATHPGS